MQDLRTGYGVIFCLKQSPVSFDFLGFRFGIGSYKTKRIRKQQISPRKQDRKSAKNERTKEFEELLIGVSVHVEQYTSSDSDMGQRHVPDNWLTLRRCTSGKKRTSKVSERSINKNKKCMKRCLLQVKVSKVVTFLNIVCHGTIGDVFSSL